jgi:hypothetical protein
LSSFYFFSLVSSAEPDRVGPPRRAPEARLDGARKEIAFLYRAFFAFHAASVLLLFSSVSADSAIACRRSWIPCLISLLSSLAMLWALRYKSDTVAVLERLLAREREDSPISPPSPYSTNAKSPVRLARLPLALLHIA